MEMNKIILAASFLIMISVPAYADEYYSKNYQAGYKQGYTYNEGGLKGLPPLPPLTPLPNLGDTDQDAYTRGVLEGKKAKEEMGL